LFLFLVKGCNKDQEVFSQAVQENISETLLDDSSEGVETDYIEDKSDGSLPGLENKYGSDTKAFPSAIGHGRNSTGGRGGRVIFVENLNDSGAGSLRWALESAGKRNIVIRVSGIIDLKSDINIVYPNMTFEGNTAPGDGVVVRGGQISILSSNHIIRNLSVMVGENAGPNKDGLQLFGGDLEQIENIIVDHCSLSHATDENLGISAVKDVTISNCIISNNLGNGGSLVGADRDAENITFVKNLQIWNDERNPRLQRYGKVEYLNNMFYGFVTPAQMSYGSQFDMIGNIWENETNSKERYTIDMLSEGGVLNENTAFIFDNLYDGATDFGVDNDLFGHFSSTRIIPSEINPIPSTGVRGYIIQNVGSRRKSENGLNQYDQELINDILNKVFSNYDTSPYNFPNLVSGEPYDDSDKDGMDDYWEFQQFGTLDQTETTDFNGNGYTDLEEFLFALNNE